MTARENLTKSQLELVDDVLKEYGDKSGYHLECLTHAEDPWRAVRAGLSAADKCDKFISKEEMKKYYRSRLRT